MATASTQAFQASAAVAPSTSRQFARRQITPEAGKALEKLGHAIEYLTDEFVHSGASFNANNAQLEAVQLLMALNRKVYFECPQVPTLAERLRWLLHPSAN